MTGSNVSPALLEALTVLLQPGDFARSMMEALRCIAEATSADRVYVFENHWSGDALLASQRYEWVRAGVSAQSGNAVVENIPLADFSNLLDCLRGGRAYQRTEQEFDEREQAVLMPQGIRSLACVPVVLEGELWGFLGVDDCQTARHWQAGDLFALGVAAVGVGGAIVQRRAREALTAKAEELRRQRAVALSLIEDAQLAAQRADEANQAKTAFLAMISHDIRTPLNGVIGSTELLLAEPLSPRQDEIVRTIQACGETLLGLVSDVLDISRIESRGVELEPTVGSLRDCVESVERSFREIVAQRGIEFHVHIAPDCPATIRADLRRLRQILLNLIGNAVKFTERGSVRVEVSCERAAEGNVRLHVAVTDTGVGIDPDEIEGLFEPFRQGLSARQLATGGSGLGLAICRRLAEAMGGGITATSEPGIGSCFRFHVLVERAAAASTVEDRADPALDSEAARILVVDDVEVNRRLLVQMLRMIGHESAVATSGEDALALLAKQRFDVVFMDVLMPGINGLETTRRIRQREQNGEAARTWIIALTADAMVENREHCARAGMDDFATKPIRVQEIRACLERWRTASPGATPAGNGDAAEHR